MVGSSAGRVVPDTGAHGEATDRLFRAAIPGRPDGISTSPGRVEDLWAPGRSSLEGAVLCATLAILCPLAALGSIAFALRTRRAGNGRWMAALLAGVWCCFLGSMLRAIAGLPLIP